jgi:hypothetical protein
MISELEMILSERDYDTVPLDAHITKTTEETIFRFAEQHKIDYDVALEILIRYGASDKTLWESNLV